MKIEDIVGPQSEGRYKERAADISRAMDQAVIAVVEGAARAGWRRREVYDALSEVIVAQRLHYEVHSDPCDDTQILGG